MAWDMLTHGTLAAYKTHRCRCAECRTANAIWSRQYARRGEHVTDKIGTKWMLDAACRDYPTEWWFAPRPAYKTYQEALKICADCPVRTTCLSWALQWPAHDLHGIWGGTSQRERTRLLDNTRKAPTCLPTPVTLRTTGRVSGISWNNS